MKSTAKIKELAVRMTKETTDKRFRHKTCQYSQAVKGGERFCTLTTNKKCTNCTFYDPTIGAVLESLVKEIERTQTAKKVFDKRAKTLKSMISKAKETEKDIDRMKAEVKKEYERVHIAKYDIVSLWQDSVNTYE